MKRPTATRDVDRDESSAIRALPVLLVTVNEAARMLSVGRTAVYQLMWSGDLTAIHIGRSVRLRVDQVEDFVLQRCATSPHGNQT